MTDHRPAIEATIPTDPDERAQWCCDAIEVIADQLANPTGSNLGYALEGFGLLYRLGRNRIAKKFMEPSASNPDADRRNGA